MDKKIDTTNESQSYWNQLLSELGLSVKSGDSNLIYKEKDQIDNNFDPEQRCILKEIARLKSVK